MQLRELANVSGYPRSASNYQYQSLAVQADNLANVYRKDKTNTFFSFIIVFPILAIIIFFIIILSNHDSIEEKLQNKEQHKNFAAVIGLGLNIAAYVTVMDIWGLCWFTEEGHGGREIYFSKEDTQYEKFKCVLIAHVVVESLFSVAGEFCFIILACTHCCRHKQNKLIKPWWIPLILFIPPIWCLASHFGFIVIAWSSFVRRGKALTLVYVIGATVMFIVMRQTYKVIDSICMAKKNDREKKEGGTQNVNKENGKKEQEGKRMDKEVARRKQEEGTEQLIKKSGKQELEVLRKDKKEQQVSFWIILVVRVVGLILVGAFFYIMLGLWLVPSSETVEESPVYLSDSLHLIIVVLAVLVSYKISFGDDEVGEPKNKDAIHSPTSTPNPSPSPSCNPKSCIQGVQ